MQSILMPCIYAPFRRLLVLTTVFALALGACMTHAEPVTSREHGYSLQVPPDWKTRHTPGGKVDLALLSPREGGKTDAFIENLTIIVKPKTAGKNARSAANHGVSHLRRRVKGFKIIEQGEFDTGTSDAYRIVYEGELEGRKIRNTAYAVVGDEIVLTITGSALTESHDTYSTAFDQLVGSIAFNVADPS